MSDDNKHNKQDDKENRDEENQEDIALIDSRTFMFLVIMICVLSFFSITLGLVSPSGYYGKTSTSSHKTPATEIIDRPYEEMGTYTVVSQTESSKNVILTYATDNGNETITVDSKNFTREQGEDGTVDISKQQHDKAEIESGKVVRENATQPTYKAVVYYNPDKQELSQYKLVSLAKNGGSAATLTYEEASGITDTVSIFPSLLEIVDDGSGIVEKVSSYDESGAWKTHWVVHSLS